MESLTTPADQISIQDLIQLLVSTTSKLKLETCSNKIEELHGKQEYDEVERSDGEYLEEGYVLVDRDPQTKTQRRVDRAAATENANKKHPELNIHQRLPIIEAQIRPKASSPPTAQIPHKPNAHQALPIVETPIQAQPARATRPPGLERSPLSEAQKIEVVMLEIDAEVVSNKKDGDCQIWANLSASDRELWIYWKRNSLFTSRICRKMCERDVFHTIHPHIHGGWMYINPSDPGYHLYKTFAGLQEELFILDCARRQADRQFKEKWGFVPTVRGTIQPSNACAGYF